MKSSYPLSPITRSLASAKSALVSVGVFSFFINLLMLTGPLFMLQVYDRVLISRSLPTLVSLTILMAAMFAFMGILDLIRSRILVRVGNRVSEDLQKQTFNIWLKQGAHGIPASRLAPLDDLENLRQFVSGSAPGVFFDVPWAPFYLGVIFLLHWTLGVFATVGVVVIVIAAILHAVLTKTLQAQSHNRKSASVKLATQSHETAETVLALGMGEALFARWKAQNDDRMALELITSDRAGGIGAFSKSFRMFLQSGILAVGGALAINQTITPGAMIAGSIILGRAIAPLQMLIAQWYNFGAARRAYTRLKQIYKDMPEATPKQPLPVPKGYITVENMTAGAPQAKEASLRSIHFQLEPGDGLAIIGPSGSGKTSLTRLLVGAWHPQRGSVRLDGAKLDQWSPQDLGQYVGYLPQKAILLDGSISDNISRFSLNPNKEQILRAAEQAGVHELILGLPQGYNTQLGEGGVVLSSGQTQRIALARALYGDPCLVVLDEPNANLDYAGDMALSRTLTELRTRGRTVIIVTHKTSIISTVNKVLTLKDGNQTDFGLKENVLQTPKPLPARPQPSSATMPVKKGPRPANAPRKLTPIQAAQARVQMEAHKQASQPVQGVQAVQPAQAVAPIAAPRQAARHVTQNSGSFAQLANPYSKGTAQ